MANSALLGRVEPAHLPAGALGGVEIVVRGAHAYKNRGKNKNGCGHVFPSGDECRKAQAHHDHLSLPLSLNVVGSRGGHHTYRTFKAAWEELLHDKLEASPLVAGWHNDADPSTRIQSVSVEALLCFPVARFARDQGNFRWFLEKCLGDTLAKGGWIEDDSIYPERRFDFGGLEIEHRPGESWTRMLIFPSYG